MSLETPRSSAGNTTPRTFQEVFGDYDVFQDLHLCIEKCASDEGDLSSRSSSSEVIYDDDCKLKVISKLINVCSECDKCDKEALCNLLFLEKQITDESLMRQRQMQLMIGFEKKTRDWFLEKNAAIEQLQLEKNNTEIEQHALMEKLETVSKHLLNLENSFNDVHKKYEQSKHTVQILSCNVETLKNSLKEYEECMKLKQVQFDQLKDHAIERLNQANDQLDLAEKNYSSECSKLRAAIAYSETKVQQLTQQLEQKTRENTELMSICEFLLQSLKKTKNHPLDELIHTSVTMWLNDMQNNS